ncbi:MAG: CPBP family intramembrane glutamic endopeptidase [bacterium]
MRTQTKRSSFGALLFNQTLAAAGLAFFIFFVLYTDKGQSLLFKYEFTVFVLNWLAHKIQGFSNWDWLWGSGLILLMGVGNVIQQHFIFKTDLSQMEWLPHSGWQKAGFVYLVFTTAFTEEIVFRGVILPAVSFWLFPSAGLLISAGLFGVLHAEKGWRGQVAVGVYGVILGGALLIGASLWVCIIAHGLNNVVALFILPAARSQT